MVAIWAQAENKVQPPVEGRRLQIRNNHRQIIGYIERDGTVTNTLRQKVGVVEETQ